MDLGPVGCAGESPRSGASTHPKGRGRNAQRQRWGHGIWPSGSVLGVRRTMLSTLCRSPSAGRLPREPASSTGSLLCTETRSSWPSWTPGTRRRRRRTLARIVRAPPALWSVLVPAEHRPRPRRFAPPRAGGLLDSTGAQWYVWRSGPCSFRCPDPPRPCRRRRPTPCPGRIKGNEMNRIHSAQARLFVFAGSVALS
jgi:hypothetical protein